MIVRIEIEGTRASFYEYRVSYDAEELYTDAGLQSVEDSLVGAIEGMPPEALAAEIWYRGVVSGTYPLPVIAGNLEQVAQHAANTAEAIHELTDEG